MPVREKTNSEKIAMAAALYQRKQYAKGGIGRKYWDFRDEGVFSEIPSVASVILDAGCGEGITLGKLVRRFDGAKVMGVDRMEENVAICKKFGLPAEVGDLERLAINDRSVDCCCLIEVIEHIRNVEAVIGELWRILTDNGRLIVVFPHDASFRLARLATFRFREAAYDPGHVHQWTPQTMQQLLSASGFVVKKTKCMPFWWWPISLHGVIVADKQATGPGESCR